MKEFESNPTRWANQSSGPSSLTRTASTRSASFQHVLNVLNFGQDIKNYLGEESIKYVASINEAYIADLKDESEGLFKLRHGQWLALFKRWITCKITITPYQVTGLQSLVQRFLINLWSWGLWPTSKEHWCILDNQSPQQ